MQKHLKLLAVSLVAASLSIPAVAQEAEAPSADTVMATVNGEDITLGHMIAARATLPQQYDNAPPEQLFAGILQQLIQQTALAQKIDTLPGIVAFTLQNEARSLKAAAAVEEALQGAVSEEDLKALYDARYSDFVSEEEFNASHILVETEEEALAVKEAIEGGASFAATAREKSTGPSGPNGGELGWFGTGMMVPTFEAAVIALEVDEVSDPVETQFGWHIIKLNDLRKTEPPSIDSVREELTGELNNAAARDIIDTAANAAELVIPDNGDIDPEILTRRDLLDQ
ncbi:MAG: peptidylprolyl isomerase [Pseudomonadota bacterium]